jgi:hypothetical protein
VADIRTLKLNLLADVSDFNRGLHGSTRATKTFAGKVGHYTRRVAQSFALAGAAAGALAVKIGVDGVKAAIEDEASQARLAKTLRNTMHATEAQTAAIEKQIRTEQLAKGFTDTQLRAAYGRIIASTKDRTKALEVLRLAEDTARGTGRDLETVTLAIARAYDGNLGALKRLGVPLDANIIKTKDSKAALKALSDLYGGQASEYADTFAGKVARLTQTMNELKESFGAKIIDKLNGLLPYIQRVADVLGGTADASLSNKVKALRRGLDGEGTSGADSLAGSLKAVGESFGQLYDAITGGKSGDANSRLKALSDALYNVAGAINAIANAYRRFQDLRNGKENPILSGAGNFARILAGLVNPLTLIGTRASGGPVMGGSPYLVGERGPELFVPSTSGSIVPNNRMGGGTTVININGVVDAESARRSIERLIQQSSRRTGPVNWAGGVA